jgi:hypothetical protein
MEWFDRDLISCKIGTIPALVLVHGSDKKKLAVGKWIRVKESEGARWTQVYVTEVREDGYFFASR